MPIASEITAVVGPNAAGKTALLHALSKLFGVSRAQRTVQRSDFHVGADEDIDDHARNHRTVISAHAARACRQSTGLSLAARSALGGRRNRRGRGVAGAVLGR
nr:DUF2813 domain-containing protein [Sphingomonas sp.]